MTERDDLPYTLTYDEEHGAFYGRWYCRLCDAGGVDEQPHGDEHSAMVAARAHFLRTHRKHAGKLS